MSNNEDFKNEISQILAEKIDQYNQRVENERVFGYMGRNKNGELRNIFFKCFLDINNGKDGENHSTTVARVNLMFDEVVELVRSA